MGWEAIERLHFLASLRYQAEGRRRENATFQSLPIPPRYLYSKNLAYLLDVRLTRDPLENGLRVRIVYKYNGSRLQGQPRDQLKLTMYPE